MLFEGLLLACGVNYALGSKCFPLSKDNAALLAHATAMHFHARITD